jgi:hypothetical protein
MPIVGRGEIALMLARSNASALSKRAMPESPRFAISASPSRTLRSE